MSSFKAQESLSEQIAQHLARQIIHGDLLAGDRIQELRVAGELEVSRGSVREALLILERWHLIDILPRRGAVVKDMSEEHVRSLYEMLNLLFGFVAGKAMARVSEDELVPFIELIRAMQAQSAARQVDEFHESAFQFLSQATRFGGNSFVEEILDDMQPAVRRAFYLALHINRDEMQESLAFFKALIESLLQQDAEAAREVIGEFVERQRDLVLDSIMRARMVEEAWNQRHRRS
ncbi:MAG: GntR family transcriptional regulator [Gammaproteobacteria bacterium]